VFSASRTGVFKTLAITAMVVMQRVLVCDTAEVSESHSLSRTVIPRLTKIIRSGITFISRNTHTDGKDKLLEWPDLSCLLLYVSARVH